nr:iron chelate uptake ABC transporter family permease subunit [Quadrisphaera granulorum]
MALGVTGCLSVSVGAVPIPMSSVPGALLGLGEPRHVTLVVDIRLPRAVCGLLVGLAFGMSGAIFQSLVRNELASPDVIGVTAGASAAAVLMIVVVGAGALQLSLAALVGGLGTAALVYLLAHQQGISGYRLILVGIGVAAALSAFTSYLLLRADITDLRRADAWLTGSLNNRDWEQVAPLALAMVALVPGALVLRRSLRGLQLGDDAAKALGLRVGAAKGAILVVGVALAAFATAAAGPVVFVAFVAAPVARRVLGNGDLALLTSGLFGALLVTVADLVARTAVDGVEMPVGVVTGLIGAPYLVWLLVRTNRSRDLA